MLNNPLCRALLQTGIGQSFQGDGVSCRVRLLKGSPNPANAHVVIVDDILRTGERGGMLQHCALPSACKLLDLMDSANALNALIA